MRKLFISLGIIAIVLFPSLLRGETGLPMLESTMMALDSIPLITPEGIWEYPAEEVKVLIRRTSDNDDTHFDITVLESFECSLTPGEILGHLTLTAEKNKYELNQYTRRKRGLLDLPGRCIMTLSTNGDALLVSTADKVTVTLNPMSILPRFWRIVRLRTKQGSKTPAEGLRKIYPSETPRILKRPLINL